MGIVLLKSLAINDNNLSITSTHYHKLTTIGSQLPSQFQNFYFSAHVHENGSLSYDCLMSPESSMQNTAFDILRVEYIDSDYLDTIKNGEKRRRKFLQNNVRILFNSAASEARQG
ncbi:MAG: hypothetical protein ACPGEF_00170 [Endozoicomonas sp.]